LPVLDIPPAIDRLPELLTPAEYVAVTRFNRDAVYAKLRSGEIPSVRIGRLYRIPRSALTSTTAPKTVLR